MKPFIINADLIRCALAWTYKGDPAKMKYPALNRIRVEPHHPGCVIIATCAHAMFIAYDVEADVPEPALLSVPEQLVDHLSGRTTLSRCIRFTASAVELIESGKVAKKYVMQGEEEYLLRGMKAHYVNWRMAIPSKLEFQRANPVIPVVMNMEFLGRLGKMWEGWPDHRNVIFATCGKPALDPKTFDRSDARNFFAFFPWKSNVLLMFAPMGDGDASGAVKYPGWLEEPKQGRKIEDPFADAAAGL